MVLKAPGASLAKALQLKNASRAVIKKVFEFMVIWGVSVWFGGLGGAAKEKSLFHNFAFHHAVKAHFVDRHTCAALGCDLHREAY